MANTPNLGLPELTAAQAQKHVTHNEALRLLDTVVQLAVLDRDLTSPPGGATSGDRHIVAAGAAGDWAGQDGKVATFVDGGWSFLSPSIGWLAFAADEGLLLHFTGTGWQTVPAPERASFYARKSATQSGISAGVGTKVTFDLKDWDVGGHYDVSTSRFTPSAGTYQISAVMHVGGIDDNSRIACQLYRNGGLFKSNYESCAGGANQNASIDVLVQASGSDFFEIYLLAEGTTAKTVYHQASLSWFTAFRL